LRTAAVVAAVTEADLVVVTEVGSVEAMGVASVAATHSTVAVMDSMVAVTDSMVEATDSMAEAMDIMVGATTVESSS
jgi:hypothetical protein